MRTAGLLALVVVVGCSFDWDTFDPRIGAMGGSAGAASSGNGGATATTGAAGAGGSACTDLCDGECVDVLTDPLHCGDCITVCGDEEVCRSGSCGPPGSCNELHMARPALGTGVYTLVPNGVEAFEAHCDMSIEGGGWTLVASVVDNSHFADTAFCNSLCDTIPATTCDESPFTTAGASGDVAGMLTADHKSIAYESVPFDEMLFVDSNGHYASYEVSGESVLAWYPAGLENYVPEGTEAHASFSYAPKASDLDPSVNGCGTLRVSFNVEDSDSPPGGSCHDAVKGPSWSQMANDSCFWDDAGVPWIWGAFYVGNVTTHRLWLVR